MVCQSTTGRTRGAPNLPGFIVASSRGSDDCLVYVRQLWNTRRWNVGALKGLLSDLEVAAIRNLHIPLFGCKDCWMCYYTKDGGFLVKSDYNLITMEQRNDNDATSNSGCSNIWNFDRKRLDVNVTIYKAMGIVGEFKHAKDIINTFPHTQLIEFSWKPPQFGVIKDNSDAGIFYSAAVGLGGVMCDSVGNVVVSTCLKMEGSFALDVAKAIATRHAMKVTIESGLFRKVCLETDSLKLHNHLVKGLITLNAFAFHRQLGFLFLCLPEQLNLTALLPPSKGKGRWFKGRGRVVQGLGVRWGVVDAGEWFQWYYTAVHAVEGGQSGEQGCKVAG
uniref:RNase H type-1 domain-containing protein n=1 Tax=Chenopodium quinoa TaxID=63459 RepID=A0A803N9D2_CHEQI